MLNENQSKPTSLQCLSVSSVASLPCVPGAFAMRKQKEEGQKEPTGSAVASRALLQIR